MVNLIKLYSIWALSNAWRFKIVTYSFLMHYNIHVTDLIMEYYRAFGVIEGLIVLLDYFGKWNT